MLEHLIHLSPLPYTYGGPEVNGELRRRPEDFVVEEELGFEPSGEGEHVFLFIEKTGLNTQQLADQLAKIAKVPARNVSYSGMKDRHAITRQWFSVHLPGNINIDWSGLASTQTRLLKQVRHSRKLRRGTHQHNAFVITIHGLSGQLETLEPRLELISGSGVPNYFGEQRFGRNGMNLHKAQQWFAGEFKPRRHQRGLYLSAVRSFLFNQVLGYRVNALNWNQCLNGDLMMLDGSRSLFLVEHQETLIERLTAGDIHPTGPLAGRPTGLQNQGEAARQELSILEQYSTLLDGLKGAGAKSDRRPLRVIPKNVEWRLSDNSVELSFSLPSGSFATSVVREVVNYAVTAASS